MVSNAAGATALRVIARIGTAVSRKLTWTSGWARKVVRMLSSSWEWCTACSRHRDVTWWLPRWISQSRPSMASTARTMKHQPGTTLRRGSTSQGARRASSVEKPAPSSTISGTTTAAWASM